jgi:hypothetical protein
MALSYAMQDIRLCPVRSRHDFQAGATVLIEQGATPLTRGDRSEAAFRDAPGW